MIIAYYVIGVPVSYICGFTLKMGIVGLIIGRVVGKVIQLIFYSILVIRTDWDEQVERAQDIMRQIAAKRPPAPELEKHAEMADVDDDDDNASLSTSLLKTDDDEYDDHERDNHL